MDKVEAKIEWAKLVAVGTAIVLLCVMVGSGIGLGTKAYRFFAEVECEGAR